METKQKGIPHVWLALIACLTLGLAPYAPEPHVWGKLRWVLGGGKGMKLIDWMDLLMHGVPWLYLLAALVHKALSYVRAVRQ